MRAAIDDEVGGGQNYQADCIYLTAATWAKVPLAVGAQLNLTSLRYGTDRLLTFGLNLLRLEGLAKALVRSHVKRAD